MQKAISIKLLWNFVEMKLHGSSCGFAAFLLNTFLRDISGGTVSLSLTHDLFSPIRQKLLFVSHCWI